MFNLVLFIQVAFLLFLPCLLVVAVWIGNKSLIVLDGHLERLQETFGAIEKQQTTNHEILIAILQKVIAQGAGHK